jgi:UDP-N-acetylmuramate--alanine ligase
VAAARLLRPARVVAIFEPWGSLRSETLATEFGRSLGLADAAIVLPHVGTVTEVFPGAATAALADAVRAAAPGRVVATARDYADGRDLVGPLLGPGTVCLVLGCGPVERFSSLLLRADTTDRSEHVTG